MVNYEKLEKKLDEINGEFGTKEKYCLFCGVNEYNSKVGIIHFENCVILELRKIIKNGRNKK